VAKSSRDEAGPARVLLMVIAKEPRAVERALHAYAPSPNQVFAGRERQAPLKSKERPRRQIRGQGLSPDG
jgi:hypothetical protein